MKGLFQGRKKRWRRGISFVVVLAVLFSLLPTDLTLFKLPVDVGKSAQAAGFTVKNSRTLLPVGSEYVMQSQSESLYIDGGTAANYQWEISAPDSTDPGAKATIALKGATDGKYKGKTATIQAKGLGPWGVRVQGLDDMDVPIDGEKYEFQVNVQTFILGPLEPVKDATSGKVLAEMTYPHKSDVDKPDGKKALFLRPGQELVISNRDDDSEAGRTQHRQEMNLLFASGTGSDTYVAEWTSGNESILKVNDTDGRENRFEREWTIQAVGVGHTTLTVEVTQVTGTRESLGVDTIEVYVNPSMRAGSLTADDVEASGESGIQLKSGDAVIIDNLTESVGEASGPQTKVDWVVWQRRSGDSYMVSEGYNNGETTHIGTGYDERDANFRTFNSVSGINSYEFRARPGVYYVAFFPSGIYSNEQKEDKIGTIIDDIPPEIGFRFKIKVPSKWRTHDVTLDVGGTYNLADGLGISAQALQDDFKIEKVSETSSGVVTGPFENISKNECVLRANDEKEGNAVYRITRIANNHDLEGVPKWDSTDPDAVSIQVTVYVKESFRISTSTLKIPVSDKRENALWGVFGSGNDPQNPIYDWDVAFKNETNLNPRDYLSIPKPGDKDYDRTSKYLAYYEALKVTPSQNPLILTLSWTDENGITQLASCEIDIVDTATDITIVSPTDDPIKMEKGEDVPITITTKGGSVSNIEWISSDDKVFDLLNDEDKGKPQRIIHANETGEATLLLMNPDTHLTVSRKIIVIERMETIKIKAGPQMKSTTYNNQPAGEVGLKEGYLDLSYDYTPNTATETDVVWSINEAKPAGIASIDSKTGKLSFTGLDGWVKVRVEAADNAKRIEPLYDELWIHIASTPMTAVALAEEEIWVIRGERRTVKYTITPQDAYDAENLVAKAGDDGKYVSAKVNFRDSLIEITGSAATPVNSLTTVTVSCTTLGTTVESKTIKVHVTEPLTSIAFDQEEYTVQVGKTIDVGLIYAPSENVDKSNVKMVTENPKIATLTEKLENAVVIGASVTGVSVGDVTIHVMATELGIDGMKSCVVHVIEPIVVAGDFAVDPEKKTIKEGETFEIMPIFTPANPTDQTVEYTSSDESVATVSPDGIVKGVAVSEVPVMITCTYVPTGKVAICMVTVESRVKLKLNPTKKTIVKGRSFTITKTITPSKFKNTPVQWKSSNSKIATVSQAGKVKTKKTGTCIITCYLVNYNVKATCTVKVTKVKTTLKLNKSSIRINIGQTYKLKSTVTSNDTVKPSVRYTSRNKKIASVGSKTGKIKGKKVGSTVITARTTDSARATARCRVTVIRRATSLDLNKHYAICYIGGTIKLKAAVKPNTTTIKKLQWSTSDNTIASVDQNGKVSGLMEGDIYITVKTTDGSNLSDRCYVRVMDAIPASSITIAQTKLTMKKGDTADLTYQLLPTNTTDTVTMATDNKRVARVTDDGRITAVGTGAATITIMTTSGTTTTVEVHVVDLNKSSLRIRQYDTETLLVTGADETVTWYSENNRIASVENGTVTGRGVGTTYVYAYIDGCKLSCRVQIVSVNNMQR